MHVPAQAAPTVQVNVPEQRAGDVVVNVPQQAAPDVVVNVPEQRAGDVVVNVPSDMTMRVTEMPARKTTSAIERNSAGEIVQTTQIEKDV